MSPERIDRRGFLGASAAFSIVPSFVLGGNPPSNRLNIGLVGIAGRGRVHCKNKDLQGENMVALCDVDSWERVAEAYETFPISKGKRRMPKNVKNAVNSHAYKGKINYRETVK